MLLDQGERHLQGNNLFEGQENMIFIRIAAAVVLFTVCLYRLISGDNSPWSTALFLVSASTLLFVEWKRRKKPKQ